MKKVFKNKLLKILLSSTIALPVVVALPSIIIPKTNIENSNIINSSLNSTQQTKSMNFDWTDPPSSSESTYSFDNTENSSNYSLDSPMQNKTIDETNSSFATISSSNASTNKKDHIAKFWLNSVTQTKQDSNNTSKNVQTVSIPGERQWLVKLSDLGSKIGVSDTTKLEITSLIYSAGGEIKSKALFVIVHSSDTTTAGSFLFQIKYEDDVKEDSLKAKSAGSYRLAKRLSSSSSDKYNFGTIDSSSTHTMFLYKIPNISSSSSSDQLISYLQLGDSNFGSDGIETSKNIKIEQSNISSNFASSKTYKPIFVYRSSSLGGSTYIFYQIEKYDENQKDKSLVSIKVNLSSNSSSGNEITVNSNDFKKIQFYNSNEFTNDKPFNTTFLEQNSSTFELFFTQKESKKENSTQRVTFDFDFSSSKTYTTNLFENLALNKTNYLIDVKKIYINQTSNVDGYVFLDNNNKVYKLDRDFNNAKLIYDFNASTYDLGNIKKFFTVPGNGSWFAQKNDSKLVQFSDGTLIGQLDTIYNDNSYELPMNVSLISQDALDPSVSYKKLSNGSSDYDSSFKNFLNSPDAYKSFLNVNFQDPRFNQNPQIKVVPKSGNFNSYSSDVQENPLSSKKYEIELQFKQTLRQIDKSGQITNNTKEITIASQKYVFNNAQGKVTFAKSKDGESSFEVPSFIKNKLPTEITKEEVENYLVKYENVSNVKVLSNPDNSKGQLTINVSVPYMWDGSELKTNQNFSKVYTEFFQSDKFGNAAKVTQYDDDYFSYIDNAENKNEYEKNKRQTLLTTLKSKYSSVLPSSLSIKEMLDSFAEYGPAFKQQSNIDDGLIELPRLQDISIIPYDTEGYANINITFPKIDSKTNVKVSFNTPKIFLKNKLAGTNVFFKFKDEKDAVSLTASDSSKLNFGSLNPSVVASKLNSGSNSDKSIVVSYLKNFAEFGNYFDKSIIDGDTIVLATGNDSYGSLKITVADKDGSVLLPGYGKNSIEDIFTGFKKNNATTLTNDNFSFNELLNISNISPLDVNANYLRTNNAFNFNSVSGTSEKLKDSNIKLIPSTISGTLQVTVSLENYVENNMVVPYKSFTKIYSGFRKSKDSVDMVVWKSITEINNDNPGYSNNRPSVIINTVNDSGNNKSDLEKLKIFSNISNDLEKSIKENNGSVSIIMSPDDSRGILNISASITINGQLTALNTSISGFANDGTLASSVVFDSPEIKQALSDFQKNNRIPSSITQEEASKLYVLKNASWYSKDVTLVPDDAKGTLMISVMILDKDGNQILEKPSTNEFLGFAKFIPTDTGTNWGIVAASIIIPAIIFIIPIIVIGIYQERIQMRKIAKTLDRRLNEEYKKNKKI